jgi:zinc protease
MTKSRFFKQISWLGLIIITLVMILFSYDQAIASTAKRYTELEFPPLKEVQLPEYERYQLDNGMIVYLIEDRKLPLVKGSMFVRIGSRFESGDQVGLTDLMGDVMRSGGTKNHDPDTLNQILEQRAAMIETSVSEAATTISFDTLTEDLDTVFSLFAEVIRQPAFDSDQFQLAKTQYQGAIARRNDNPGDIASREFYKLVYGEDSPYARTVEYVTLNNINREDLIRLHSEYFYPEQTILGIVGDFDSKSMKKLIEAKFGDWQKAPIPLSLNKPNVKQKYQDGVFLVDQPQLTQSNIFLGHLGGQFDDPDYANLDVLNGVLNGFGGRLFNELRSRQGLAYSVYAYWSPRHDYPGVFIMGGQTRSEATVPFIQSILGEIEQLRTEPITPEELAYAKDSILNSFVFFFRDPSQTLSRLMRYEYYGYPSDFIFTYQNQVQQTTIEDVQRVANQHLKPEDLVILVVGNGQEIQPPLSSLGSEITAVDITIPQS